MKDETNGFPKFQYSVFTKNGLDGQYVVRSNDWDEFLEIQQNILTLLMPAQAPVKTETKKPSIGPTMEEQLTPDDVTEDGPPERAKGGKECPVHENEWMSPKEGKYGLFWSHFRKMQDGSYDNCSGRGYKSEFTDVKI